MLEIKDIEVYYGDSYILQRVSLSVGEGTVVGLLGRNGVGKTTLIRSIIGFNPPRRGEIVFNGKDITNLFPEQIARLGIGLVPQGRRVFPSLTVAENLSVGAHGKTSGTWSLESAYELFPRLRERASQWANKLSGGEQQMLAVARALMGNPSLLLMDEPTEGLAPLMVRQVEDVLRRLKEKGLSILLVEQNLAFAEGLADFVYIMNKGEIVCGLPPGDFKTNKELKRLYLGV